MISRTITRPAKPSALARVILPACLIPVRDDHNVRTHALTSTACSSMTIAVLRAIEADWAEFPVSIVEEIDEHRGYFVGIPAVLA